MRPVPPPEALALAGIGLLALVCLGIRAETLARARRYGESVRDDTVASSAPRSGETKG